MRLTVSLSAALIVLFVAGPHDVVAAQSNTKRVIALGVIPTDALEGARVAQATTREGDMAVMEFDGIGQFGFTPTVSADGKAVDVVVSDASSTPVRKLGQVTVPVGGKPVESKTKPSFSIRVLRVTEPK